MSGFVEVARVGDIPDGETRQVVKNGRAIALFNLGGEFFATDDACTHEEASLSEGYVEGDEVECARHAAIFNIKTGQVVSLPATRPVKAYAVQVIGDSIQVDLGAS